ncbi:glycosyltransferase family 4 protein [Algibacter pectinivorans]|uniref:Glycosyltransferase involved in cell wall bisynthesis n=1 Tax=Algibacter pectinivorans TaxID=870482 RepID=A0A1I1P5F4_9FLAO|nr:glycosyltransferase [Algibacter pectinivorans]SFD02898.1 Glycosyltransferase involved in cell wall bisynthesis [Algibacter pectinivorans]
MKFLIITHVKHKRDGRSISAYAPYVREMNLWLKHVDEVTIIAPKTEKVKNVIDLDYNHHNLKFKKVDAFQFTNLKKSITSVFKIPAILISICRAISEADHIHLRCPGNMGLLGSLVQILFPNKVKTAKYAGNWDPKAKQPLSYRFQKWILSNTFLTKNMQVLVYGEWKNQSKNILPFFTATFKDTEKESIHIRDYTKVLKFVFIGSLVEGKRPLLAIQIIENLIRQGLNVEFNLYGDGILKTDLYNYIVENNLEQSIKLLGNRDKLEIKTDLKSSHFLILPSKSEGWPKAVAEAMFYGTIPIATSISCVPFMLDQGNRGLLIQPSLEEATRIILNYLNEDSKLKEMSKRASNWSQQYTLDVFESEIVKLLK